MDDRDVLQMVLNEIKHVGSLVEAMSLKVNTIELSTSTRLASVDKDIEQLWKEIDEIKKEQEDRLFTIEGEENVRQTSDLAITSQLQEYKEAQALKWGDQEKINTTIRNIERVLWALLTVFIGIFVTFIWQLIIHGGLGGLAVSLGVSP